MLPPVNNGGRTETHGCSGGTDECGYVGLRKLGYDQVNADNESDDQLNDDCRQHVGEIHSE